MTLDLATQMKRGMRRLAAGVSIISTQNTQGEAFAMTATSVTSVSTAPPSLLVCINTEARLAPLMQLEQRFAVNILHASQQALAAVCGSSEHNDARFVSPAWRYPENAAPYLDGCEAVFQCVVSQRIEHGTHAIVVGNVLQVQASGQAFAPLVYANGHYHHLEGA